MSRNLVKILFDNFKNSLRKPPPPTHVGTDDAGNKYFEFIPSEYYSSRRKRRFVKPVVEDVEFHPHPEWNSWLQWRRREPPTEEEIKQRMARQAQIAENAKRLDELHGKSKTVQPAPGAFPKLEGYSLTPGGDTTKKHGQ